MLGVALKTSMLAAFSQVNGDLVITSSCGSLPLVGCLAVNRLKLGGRVKHEVDTVRDVGTSNTPCCLRHAISKFERCVNILLCASTATFFSTQRKRVHLTCSWYGSHRINGSPHRRPDRMPIQWRGNNIGSLLHSAISATAVSGLVVKEIAKFSTVVITIANTDIETDSELDDQIA